MARKEQKFIHNSLEAEKSTVKSPGDSVSGEALLPGSLGTVFSLFFHVMLNGAGKLSQAAFTRALILFVRAPPS